MSDKFTVSADKFDDTFMSVDDLKNYLHEHDAAKLSKAKDAGTRAAKARKEYIERLKERIDIPDERIVRLLQNAKDAAELSAERVKYSSDGFLSNCVRITVALSTIQIQTGPKHSPDCPNRFMKCGARNSSLLGIV